MLNEAQKAGEEGAPERRKARNRLPGWTQDVVIRHGLGVLDRVLNGPNGLSYRVRLDGRASGPVFFTLSPAEMAEWRLVRFAAHPERIRNEHNPRR